MENYISINGRRIELTDEQVKQITGVQWHSDGSIKLSEFAAGDVVKVGDFEMVVLEQLGDETALILRAFYGEDSQFGEMNSYDGSYVDESCQEFAKALSEVIGWDNIVLHKVDLTSNDGLKDYGTVERRASLITAEMYRKFVEILDTVNPGRWWWLATAHSTAKHGNSSWVKCVSPSGSISSDDCDNDNGVRPFCILKSTIFVSK